MFDNQPFVDRFLAVGGTKEQLKAFAGQLTTAIDFAEIVGTGEHVIRPGDTMPPEAAAVLSEWIRAYRDYMRRQH